MGDFLSSGISGLLAFQTALSTTSHNISNVNTPGYSRQQAVLTTRLPNFTGAGWVGNGVNVSGIDRIYDQFMVDQVRTNTSTSSRLDSYYGYASQVDNMLADPSAGLSPTLQSFFDALQGVSNNPSSLSARQVLVSQTSALVDRFHTIDDRLTALRDSVNTNIKDMVSEINAYSDSLAQLNQKIVVATAQSGGKPANDLMDERDELLRKLSELVPVTSIPQDDGAVNVFFGNGQPLVLGNNSFQLGTTQDPYDAFRTEVTLAKTGTIVSDFVSGGKLGGVLDFRKEMLEPARNALGRLAAGVAMAMNAQHTQGLDLQGNVGGQFFSLQGLAGNPLNGMPSGHNTGTASVSYTLTSASALTASDYRLNYDGANYTLTRLSDNTLVGTYAPGAYPMTVNVPTEGLSMTITAGAAASDSFMLEPTRTAAGSIDSLITDPAKIAAASPLRSSVNAGNLGSGTITKPTAVNMADPNFFNTVTVQLGSSGGGAVDQYSTDGGATWNAFAAGTPLTINGWQVTINGSVRVGDQFTVQRNVGATGDNGNALAMAGLQSSPILNGATTSLQTGYAQLVSNIGSQTHQLDINNTAQKAVLAQSVANRDNVSGVNLDEEAANLVKFQQAYQASAQIINTANTLFQTLLNAVQ